MASNQKTTAAGGPEPHYQPSDGGAALQAAALTFHRKYRLEAAEDAGGVLCGCGDGAGLSSGSLECCNRVPRAHTLTHTANVSTVLA